VSKAKKRLSILLAVLTLVLSVSIVNVFAAAKGDVNGDGDVTVSDAMIVFNFISGKNTLTAEEEKKADVNSDGSINVADAMKIYNIILGKDEDEEKKEGTFRITTYGWGHDIGMSQNGANLYAKNDGADYQWILDHYYPGTTLEEKDDNAPEKVKYNGKEYSMRDYLAGVLYAEMGPSFQTEALKAQCVTIYTYGKYQTICAWLQYNQIHYPPVPADERQVHRQFYRAYLPLDFFYHSRTQTYTALKLLLFVRVLLTTNHFFF